MPPASEPVRLAWVLVGAELRHVADFAGLPPAARPAATCPVCGEPVTLRLGEVVAPHAAHRPESRCPLAHEETALHFNTKHHLASALRAAIPGPPLTLRLRCAHRGGALGDTTATVGLVPCPALHEEPLVASWDAVEVEAGLSDVRPDVLLRAGGAPVAALEVRRTHALTAVKVERLAARGLPWAEVVAARPLYAEFTAWTPDAPLTVLRSHATARWTCEYHRGRPAARARRAADGGPLPWAARVVDRYHPSGDAVREVVYVAGTRLGARLASPALHRAGDPEPLALLPDGSRAAVLRAAHAAFGRWAEGRRALGERVDSPMPWVDAARLQGDDGDWMTASALFPRRRAWDAAARRWVRRPGVGERAWVLAASLAPPPRS